MRCIGSGSMADASTSAIAQLPRVSRLCHPTGARWRFSATKHSEAAIPPTCCTWSAWTVTACGEWHLCLPIRTSAVSWRGRRTADGSPLACLDRAVATVWRSSIRRGEDASARRTCPVSAIPFPRGRLTDAWSRSTWLPRSRAAATIRPLQALRSSPLAESWCGATEEHVGRRPARARGRRAANSQ